MPHALLVLALAGALSQPAPADSAGNEALRAFVDDGAGDARALASGLRSSLGPRGAVDVVMAAFARDLVRLRDASVIDARSERLRALIDAAAAQKDGWASGLAWHTDLAAAKQEARQKKLPILSLRLLGRLDEDLSCANSRFFRTLLYPDPAVQQALQGFVLHWQTVRPAPRLTVDMGDGRTLTTTITGNSAHVVLDSDGFVVDALPGLVSPAAFVQMLEPARAMARVSRADRRVRHAALRAQEEQQWRSVVGFRGDRPLPLVGKSARNSNGANSLAVDAGPIAMTKAMPEMPIVRALSPVDVKEVQADAFYDEVADRFVDGVAFSDASLGLIRRKLSAGQRFDVVVARLRRAVAKDTIINRIVLHDSVRSWLADGKDGDTVVQERLYDELFLTPGTDPWLGLVDGGAYTGVDGGGVSVPARR